MSSGNQTIPTECYRGHSLNLTEALLMMNLLLNFFSLVVSNCRCSVKHVKKSAECSPLEYKLILYQSVTQMEA